LGFPRWASMKNSQNNMHSDLIEDWEKKNIVGLTSDQHIRLIEKAIQAIEQRAGITLSVVTLTLILDRVLHESQDKFPLLSDASIESNRLSFEKMHIHHKSEDLLEPIRYVLIELLTVLGRITADILTTPLHKELLKVTWNHSEKP
jgi:hypothetical protein